MSKKSIEKWSFRWSHNGAKRSVRRYRISGLVVVYRSDDGFEMLDYHGNQCILWMSRTRKRVYFGFKGDLNPVDTKNIASKVFRL